MKEGQSRSIVKEPIKSNGPIKGQSGLTINGPIKELPDSTIKGTINKKQNEKRSVFFAS